MLHLYFWNYSTATKPTALKFGGNKECRSPRLNVQFLSENVCPWCFNWTFNFWCNISWWMTVSQNIITFYCFWWCTGGKNKTFIKKRVLFWLLFFLAECMSTNCSSFCLLSLVGGQLFYIICHILSSAIHFFQKVSINCWFFYLYS